MMDMHCHIDLYQNPLEVIERCKKSELYVLSVTTTPSAWEGTYALTKDLSRFNTALGLHPQLAHERESELGLFDKLITKTRYIGEIGLDGSTSFRPHFDTQLRVFRHILRSCQSYNSKILSIHSRAAVKEVIAELEAHQGCGTPILHWYLGGKKDIGKVLDLGGWFSVGPAMIHSKQGTKVISWLPQDRVLLETDGPFTSIDGRPMEPCDSRITVEYLSNLWQLNEREVNEILKKNLRELCS